MLHTNMKQSSPLESMTRQKTMCFHTETLRKWGLKDYHNYLHKITLLFALNKQLESCNHYNWNCKICTINAHIRDVSLKNARIKNNQACLRQWVIKIVWSTKIHTQIQIFTPCEYLISGNVCNIFACMQRVTSQPVFLVNLWEIHIQIYMHAWQNL